MNRRLLSMCGMMAPVVFVFTAILGGAMRPGYNHLSDTLSELFSPGSPNRLLLSTLHTVFGLLLVLFGIGVLRFVRESGQSMRTGTVGAVLFIAMALLNVATATVFPQDAWGSPPTFPGRMHIALSGVAGLVSMLSMLLIGIWLNRTGMFPGFAAYSFATVAAAIVATGFFAANYGKPMMGLTERIAALVGFQWTFTLALWIFTRRSAGAPAASFRSGRCA